MKRLLNKTVSLLLAFTMLLGMTVINAGARTETVTIDVTDYFGESAEVNGVKEATSAVERALAYAKTLSAETHKTISFPKGEYHFYADYAPVREFYVSNTVGVNQDHKDKRIGILVEDMENVTVDGGSSSFIFHGNITTFAAIRTKNVTFTNFDFDHASPTVVDVTVESKVEGENAVIAYIPPAYTYTISGTTITWKGETGPVSGTPYWQGDNNLQHQQGLDTLTGIKKGGGQSALFSNVTKLEDLGGGRIKITYSGGTPPVGFCFQMRNVTRVTPGVLIWESEKTTLKDIGAHFLHGFGLVAQLTKDVTIDNVDFRAKPGTGRSTASFADFLQMSSVGGKVAIKNCDFYDPQDDPINIHGTFLTVKEVSSDNRTFTLQYRHNETGGFPQYYVGDEVDFSAKGTMVPVANSLRTVTAVENFPGGDKNLIKITVDQPLAGIIGNNNSHVVENVTYTPEVEIINNRFVETPTRGILVTTRKPILIEDNYFDAMGMGSIYISCDAQGWYESGHTEDVIIRNNVFDRLTKSAVLVKPTGNNDSSFQLHKKILVENNVVNIIRLNGVDGEGNVNRVVNAKSVENLVIQNNTINRYEPNVGLALAADSRTLSVNGTQATTLTQSGTALSEQLYRFENCKNVTIRGNTYDSGLNIGSELTAGTQAANVTVTNDEAKVNGNNQKPAVDQVLYYSSDPAVATVDQSGVVKGVSAGTAEIFAYTVSGVRTYESNSLTFTVTGESGGEAETPASITVTSAEGADKIDVADTLQFTAVTDPQGQEISWSVRDAATGTATDAAAIDTDGLLTAAKPGVVEVLAASKADGEIYGSKLLTVRKMGGGLGDNWVIDREVPHTWTANDDGTLTITAQKGGDWATGNGASNIFLTTAPKDDFSFTVELKNRTSMSGSSWDEAGLIVFKDNDNYVALERKNAGGTPQLAVVTETNGSATENPTKGDIAQESILLKLEKTGNSFKGSYSADSGGTWTEVRTVTNGTLGDSFKIGVIATNSEATPEKPFTFADFKIDDVPVPFVSDNAEPTASAASVTAEGTTLTLDYTFTDPDSDDEGASLFAWYAADSAAGIYRRIENAAATLTVTSALSGKYIKAAVVPVDQWGRMGAPVYTAAVQAPVVAGDRTDATLSGLEFSGLTLSPAFEGGVTAYTAFVPASATGDLHVIATATEKDANAVVTQTAEMVIVTVTAPDGETTETYTVTLAHAKDSNPALTALDLTGTGVSLSLDGDTSYYQLLVDSDVDTLRLETTAAGAATEQEVRFNYEVLKDYDGTAELKLVGGLNYVHIRTLAEDGISTRIYRVVIMKTPSSEAGLAALTVNGKGVPGFSADVETYRLETVAGEAAFAATAMSEKAKVELFLDGAPVTGPVELSAHLHTLTAKVTAENGSTTHTYTVYLVIPSAASTDLISFTTGGVKLSPAFDQETVSYTAETVGKTLPLAVQTVESKALVTVETDDAFFRGLSGVDCAVPLRDGENIVTVTVTSPDATATKTYTLTVTKNNDVYLSDLEWVSANTGDGSWNGGIPAKDTAWEGYEMSLIGPSGEKVSFAKGIGTHAKSTIVYDLTGKGYETFSAKIGVSYKKYNSDEPHLIFSILGDDKSLYTSKSMEGTTPYESVSVDVKGVTTLKLIVDQPENFWSAHGNWADAKFASAAAVPGERFGVTVSETENATVWTDRKAAEADESVTVHITDIADGYRFSSLTVTAEDGTVVETTAVTAGETYSFTMPGRAVTVSAQMERIPTSSGSGSSNTTTSTEKNPDGSTTTTVTNKTTGAVTETTKYPDGTIQKVETKKDGSMTGTETRKDGTKVESATTAAGKTTATVTVPKDKESVTVVIPTPEKPKAGEVAVVVLADGTTQVVKTSVATDKGLRVTLPEGAKLEIIDNSKSFADVAGTAWYANAVAFASSRELFQGSAGNFAPEDKMTRAMLMTVLYRFDGGSTVSGENKWYSDALAWSKETGLSDGTAPEADISREQLAVILYRYSGAPETDGMALSEFSDSQSVSSWAQDAMRWAVKSGLLQGTGGKLNPVATASRAEVATILERFIAN